MTMREKIAAAAVAPIQAALDALGARAPKISVTVSPESPLVDAILDAMREPTEAMLDAAYERMIDDKPEESWRNMIDAAKEER